jgi:hypothetical protein
MYVSVCAAQAARIIIHVENDPPPSVSHFATKNSFRQFGRIFEEAIMKKILVGSVNEQPTAYQHHRIP